MTASSDLLKTSPFSFPSVSKMIRDLDGDGHGVTMRDMVGALEWKKAGDLRVVDDYLRIGFSTFPRSGPSDIEGSFAVTTVRQKPQAQKWFFKEVDLRLSWKETESFKTLIKCRARRHVGFVDPRKNIGQVEVSMYWCSTNELGPRFPLLGYPQPIMRSEGAKDAIDQYIRSGFNVDFRPDFRLQPRQKGGAMFVALATLAFSVDWQAERLGPLIKPEDFSQELHNRLTA